MINKEREALVELLKKIPEHLSHTPKCNRVSNMRCTCDVFDLEDQVVAAIASLTAQQEPVAVFDAEEGHFEMLGPEPEDGAKLYTAPLSGVREGMLRAAEICCALKIVERGKRNSEPEYNRQVQCCDDRAGAFRDAAEAISRAAEQVNAEGQVNRAVTDSGAKNTADTYREPATSAPIPRPADGVVSREGMIRAAKWLENAAAKSVSRREYLLAATALLAAAKEPRK